MNCPLTQLTKVSDSQLMFESRDPNHEETGSSSLDSFITVKPQLCTAHSNLSEEYWFALSKPTFPEGSELRKLVVALFLLFLSHGPLEIAVAN